MRNQNVVSRSFNEGTKCVSFAKNRSKILKMIRSTRVTVKFHLPFKYDFIDRNSDILFMLLFLSLPCQPSGVINIAKGHPRELNIHASSTAYDFLADFSTWQNQLRSADDIRKYFTGFYEVSNHIFKHDTDKYYSIPRKYRL